MCRQIHIHDQFITDNYLTMPVKRMAKEINKSGCYVFNRLKVLGLVVPVEIVEQRKAGYQKAVDEVNEMIEKIENKEKSETRLTS